jgi:hypothetical protein
MEWAGAGAMLGGLGAMLGGGDQEVEGRPTAT